MRVTRKARPSSWPSTGGRLERRSHSGQAWFVLKACTLYDEQQVSHNRDHHEHLAASSLGTSGFGDTISLFRTSES